MKISLNSSFLVGLFFAIITFCKGFGLSNSNKIYIYIYIVSLLFLIVKIFKDKFNKKEFLFISSLFVLGLLDYYFGKETTLLFTAIALSSLKNMNIDSILKIMLFSRIFAFILNIVLSSLGIIENTIRNFYRNGTFIDRYGFGYGHPNTAHSSLAIIIMLLCYIYYKRLKLYHIILLEALNYIFYRMTFSRTGFIIITLYLLVILISKRGKFIYIILKKTINPLYITLFIGSFILGLLYNHLSIVNNLDKILTGRIRFISTLITEYSIPLIKNQSYKSIAFDNGYMDLLYNGGILASIIFILMQLKTNSLISKYGKNELLIYISFSLIYCLTESYYMSILMNPALIYFAIYLYDNNRKVYFENNMMKEEIKWKK